MGATSTTSHFFQVAVKLFEGLQLGLPMCISGCVFGGMRLGPK